MVERPKDNMSCIRQTSQIVPCKLLTDFPEATRLLNSKFTFSKLICLIVSTHFSNLNITFHKRGT